MTMIATVKYIKRGETEVKTTQVKVDHEQFGDKYHATNLELWGCGKSSPTKEGAVRVLVQDMATILSITF